LFCVDVSALEAAKKSQMTMKYDEMAASSGGICNKHLLSKV
jgi:hypothetical protein